MYNDGPGNGILSERTWKDTTCGSGVRKGFVLVSAQLSSFVLICWGIECLLCHKLDRLAAKSKIPEEKEMESRAAARCHGSTCGFHQQMALHLLP